MKTHANTNKQKKGHWQCLGAVCVFFWEEEERRESARRPKTTAQEKKRMPLWNAHFIGSRLYRLDHPKGRMQRGLKLARRLVPLQEDDHVHILAEGMRPEWEVPPGARGDAGVAAGVAAGGSAALLAALKILEHEIKTAMALAGVSSLEGLGPDLLMRDAPLAPAHVLSAFPLIADGY